MRRMLFYRVQGPLPVRDISRGDCDGMGQSLGIDDKVALDAGHLFAGIITSVAGAIGILDALRVNDAETRLGVAPLFAAGRANLIFLTSAPADSFRLQVAGSTMKNNDGRYAISGNHSAASATGSHSLISTAPHRIPRTDQLFEDASFCGLLPVRVGLVQIALD
jgi:hypothetical protein